MKLNDNIKTIKGIGDKTAALFARLNIHTVEDLLKTYPRNYLSYGDTVNIADAEEGQRVSILAVISTYANVKHIKGLTIVTVGVKDSTGSAKLTWFNQPYLKNTLRHGDSFVFVGTIRLKNGAKVMEHPEIYRLDKYRDMQQEYMPVYPLTKGLTNNAFVKAVKSVRPLIQSMHEYLPGEIRTACGLMEISDAYENVHFPGSESLLKNAIRRIAFDEFFAFLYRLKATKEKTFTFDNTHRIVKGRACADFIETLPFSLTKGQQQAVEDILSDMGSDHVMNRLVQGDVGSGKTVVAEAAMFACVKEGYQAALMVPTEVLAKQHYEDLETVYEGFGIKVELLVGSTPAKEKRHIYEELKRGGIDVIVGTHALIQDTVEFLNLGLVITDEQHRFGVSQREKLSLKGDYPHVLVMSATPIPRTLAIILYADMDISVISELPKGRKPIKNCAVGTSYRETAYKFIASQIAEGSQAYVICPMVNESDTLDVSNVVDYTETMKAHLGPLARVEMLHGQMKADEKNLIMERFKNGEIDVLVSTTVIEVGVNNPNATVMMVENAERFGLAQLHQLRGRVGRGKKQSYCIFISGKSSSDSMERLKVLEESNDGFFIANEDLRLRGPGDFFGIRQSGEALFLLADIYNHADMLKLAQSVLDEYGDKISLSELPDRERRTDTVL